MRGGLISNRGVEENWEISRGPIFLIEMRLSLYTFGMGKKPRNVNKEIENNPTLWWEGIE